MKKVLLVAALAAAAFLCVVDTASAGYWYGPSYYYSHPAPPVIYGPPPVYVAPAPVIVYPAPVYVRPLPVVYAPAYYPRYYGGYCHY